MRNIVIRRNVLLPAILVLGLILRLYKIGLESLWFDEVGVVDRATRGVFEFLFGEHIGVSYRLILNFWMKFFGISEISIRLPSVFFAVGSLMLTYKIGAFLFSKKVGLYSAFLLAISPFHIFYSQDATNYSLSSFLILSSMWFFFKILSRTNNKYDLIGYSIVSILALYSNLLSVIVIFLQNAFFLIKRPFSLRKWIKCQLSILIVSLLYFIPLGYFYFFKQSDFFKIRINWIPVFSMQYLLDLFKTYCYGGSGFGLEIFPEWIVFVLCCLQGGAFILGILSTKKRFYIIVLAVWIIFPVLVISFFSIFVIPLFVIRYFIFALPAFYIIVALGISRLKRKFIQGCVLWAISVLMIIPLNAYFSKNKKVCWEKIIYYVNTHINEQNDIIMLTQAQDVQMWGYYGKTGAKYIKDVCQWNSIIREDINTMRGGHIYYDGENMIVGISNFSQVEKLISEKFVKEGKNIWIILSHWPCCSEKIEAYLNQFYIKTMGKEFNKRKLMYYKLRQ